MAKVVVKNANEYIVIFNYLTDMEAKAFIQGVQTTISMDGRIQSIKLDGEEQLHV